MAVLDDQRLIVAQRHEPVRTAELREDRSEPLDVRLVVRQDDGVDEAEGVERPSSGGIASRVTRANGARPGPARSAPALMPT